jgi:hypothetical protein
MYIGVDFREIFLDFPIEEHAVVKNENAAIKVCSCELVCMHAYACV